MKIEDFVVDVPEAALDDLRRRVVNTRWPVDFANDDWRYGVARPYLEELVAYWLDAYDWRAHEVAMNTYSHHTTTTSSG